MPSMIEFFPRLANKLLAFVVTRISELAYEEFPVHTSIVIIVYSPTETVSKAKSSVFWDIMPCRPLKVSRRFGGTCRLYFRDEE
jgi:hypothetical protein